MATKKVFAAVTTFALIWPAAAMAVGQAPGQGCTAVAAPAAELAAWTSPAPLAASETAATAPQVTSGQAFALALLPAAQVRYAVAPGKTGAAASHGGLIAVNIARPGTYRVALGGAAWVDVVAAGAALRSVAHGHGPECSGVRKVVDFALVPGRYVVQIAGSEAASIRVLIAPLP